MNRLALATESISVPSLSADTSNFHKMTAVKRRPLVRQADHPHATFTPIHYEQGYAYPLIVWLHSSGGNERELRQVMRWVSTRNFVAIAPRGTATNSQVRDRHDWSQSSDQIELAEARIAECIASAQRRFHVHPQRVFLVGCGSGGTMAMRIAWNNPSTFAGVATMNGPLPMDYSPLWRINELRRVPCLLATSRDSSSYPATHVCRDLRLLHAAGCTVALRQYPCEDALTSKMLADLNCWLMELVCARQQ